MTVKGEPSVLDGIFRGLMGTTSCMQTHPTWINALIKKENRLRDLISLLLAYLCRLGELPQKRRLNTQRDSRRRNRKGKYKSCQSATAGWNFRTGLYDHGTHKTAQQQFDSAVGHTQRQTITQADQNIGRHVDNNG